MYEVVGYARSEFKPEDKNEPICGWNIYVQFEDPKVTGYKCDRFYLGDGKCDYRPEVGDRITVYYNRYGKVDNIVRV